MIARLRFVRCDECDATSMDDLGWAQDSAAEARREAGKKGWVRADGRDLCWQCASVEE